MPKSKLVFEGCFQTSSLPEIQNLHLALKVYLEARVNSARFPVVLGIDVDHENIENLDFSHYQSPIIVVATSTILDNDKVTTIRRALARHPQIAAICVNQDPYRNWSDSLRHAGEGYWLAFDHLARAKFLQESVQQEIQEMLQRQKSTIFFSFLRDDYLVFDTAKWTKELLNFMLRHASEKYFTKIHTNPALLLNLKSACYEQKGIKQACNRLKNTDWQFGERGFSNTDLLIMLFTASILIASFIALAAVAVYFSLPVILFASLTLLDCFLLPVCSVLIFEQVFKPALRKDTETLLKLTESIIKNPKKYIKEDMTLDDLFWAAFYLEDKDLICNLVAAGVKVTSEHLRLAIEEDLQGTIGALIEAGVKFTSWEDVRGLYDSKKFNTSLETAVIRNKNLCPLLLNTRKSDLEKISETLISKQEYSILFLTDHREDLLRPLKTELAISALTLSQLVFKENKCTVRFLIKEPDWKKLSTNALEKFRESYIFLVNEPIKILYVDTKLGVQELLIKDYDLVSDFVKKNKQLYKIQLTGTEVKNNIRKSTGHQWRAGFFAKLPWELIPPIVANTEEDWQNEDKEKFLQNTVFNSASQ